MRLCELLGTVIQFLFLFEENYIMMIDCFENEKYTNTTMLVIIIFHSRRS